MKAARPMAEPRADEHGVPWDELTDGRVHALKRGLDFEGPTRFVVLAARNAAARRGLAVRCVRDELGRFGAYVWVQFFDFEIDPGDSCPRCGSDELVGARPVFPACVRCGASMVVAEAYADPPWLIEEEDDGEADAPAPAGAGQAVIEPSEEVAEEAADARPVAVAPALYQGPQRRQRAWDPEIQSARRLEFYDEVRVDPEVITMPGRKYGIARFGPKQKWVLFVLRFSPDPEDAGLGDHAVFPFPLRPFAAAIDLGALDDWVELRVGPERPEDGEVMPVGEYLSWCEGPRCFLVPVAESAVDGEGS
jgi:hypothetical protein